MSLDNLLQQLAKVPTVPTLENDWEPDKSLNIKPVPTVPTVPTETRQIEPSAGPKPRVTASFQLHGDEGGGTLLGKPTDTYRDLLDDLRQRYGDRLADVHEVQPNQDGE